MRVQDRKSEENKDGNRRQYEREEENEREK